MQKSPILLALFLFIFPTCLLAQTDSIKQVGTIDLARNGFNIGLQKPYLYALQVDKSIQVYDVTNPKRAKNVGTVRYDADALGARYIDASGGYLFIYEGLSYRKFTLFDLAKPTSPKELGHVKLPYSGSGIWNASHTKNYSYLTSGDTLYVINTVNKAKPFIENRIASPRNSSWLRSIYTLSNVIYIAVDDGILIFDNSKASSPTFHSFYETGHVYMAVDQPNDRLFVAHEAGGTYAYTVLDISSPFKPKPLFKGKGKGGGEPFGKLVYKNGILAQIGVKEDEKQPVSFYDIGDKGSSLIQEIECATKNGIGDLDAMGSLFFVAKNGDIEIFEHVGPNSDIDPIAKIKIDVYPNPTHHLVNLRLENLMAENLDVRLIDQHGRTALNEKIYSTSHTLQIGHLKKGIYHCEVSNGRSIIFSENILKN